MDQTHVNVNLYRSVILSHPHASCYRAILEKEVGIARTTNIEICRAAVP